MEEDAGNPRDNNDDDDASLFGGGSRSSDKNSDGNNDVMASNELPGREITPKRT
jgi:hypothetical protein